ncbi:MULTISPECIES: Zn-ribbon domain-containing OB-fold protein [Burkholderia]|uniref:Zn-ribbon domain-containing OB-fold protein n=1 Tax=Burkholderia TaxID=32008 RepID=UPI00158DAA88|nr:OB-fold domain-containing protein [Burkholderia seminalis]
MEASIQNRSLIQPDQEFEQFLREGRFMLQRSTSSGAYVFYPRVAAPGAGTLDLQWVLVSGCGTVYATTVVRPKPPQAAYNVALVDLDEGPRMMSRVESVPPEAVHIGMRVQARIATPNEQAPCIIFYPLFE